jgi:SMODS-associated and fused to various effectors sensor domain
MFGELEKLHHGWQFKVGVPTALAGLAALKPFGFGDVLLAVLNKALGLNLSLNPPLWLGLLLMVGGIALCWLGEIARRQNNPKRIFIAFRHQSLDPFQGRLSSEDLPPEFAGREIRELECDQSNYLTHGACDPAGAVRYQLEKLNELKALRKSFSSEPMAYYGLAHVPLQFLAGCAMSTHASVFLFELDRRTNKWLCLQDRGPHLLLTVNTVEQPAHALAIAIRICVSYEVTRNDVADVLPHPFEDIRIALPAPRLDAINSRSQIDEVCSRFRRVLDELHGRADKSKMIHVFYAGPASLGFSLGRQISSGVHHRVIVHNYTPSILPRYSWAVDVTSGGPASAMVTVQKQRESRG